MYEIQSSAVLIDHNESSRKIRIFEFQFVLFYCMDFSVLRKYLPKSLTDILSTLLTIAESKFVKFLQKMRKNLEIKVYYILFCIDRMVSMPYSKFRLLSIDVH